MQIRREQMIREDFILKKMPGMNLVMPIGSKVKDFHGVLMLNDTGAFIYEKMRDGLDVDKTTELLAEEYEVTADRAREDVMKTLVSLREAGVAD